MRSLGLLLAASLCGCAAAGGAGAMTAVNAALNTGLALGAAGVSRATGGCYASCPDGTTCDTATGLCDPLPCRGRCAANEVCDQTGPLERCVPQASVELQLDTAIRPAPVERVTPR
jgi:hypothetical protein